MPNASFVPITSIWGHFAGGWDGRPASVSTAAGEYQAEGSPPEAQIWRPSPTRQRVLGRTAGLPEKLPPPISLSFFAGKSSTMNVRSRPPHIAEFACEKRPATGSRGMVVLVTLASAAGLVFSRRQCDRCGDCRLFALTVVEPGSGRSVGRRPAHIRLADGRHLVLDGRRAAPGRARPDMFEALSDEVGKAPGKAIAPMQAPDIAVPNLRCEARGPPGARHIALAGVLAPAIRLADQVSSSAPISPTASAIVPPTSRAMRGSPRSSCQAARVCVPARGWPKACGQACAHGRWR